MDKLLYALLGGGLVYFYMKQSTPVLLAPPVPTNGTGPANNSNAPVDTTGGGNGGSTNNLPPLNVTFKPLGPPTTNTGGSQVAPSKTLTANKITINGL